MNCELCESDDPTITLFTTIFTGLQNGAAEHGCAGEKSRTQGQCGSGEDGSKSY